MIGISNTWTNSPFKMLRSILLTLVGFASVHGFAVMARAPMQNARVQPEMVLGYKLAAGAATAAAVGGVFAVRKVMGKKESATGVLAAVIALSSGRTHRFCCTVIILVSHQPISTQPLPCLPDASPSYHSERFPQYFVGHGLSLRVVRHET